MERFLVRNQVPKPDPGIVNRAAKAKQHRKLEKIVDAALHKRRKLETRSALIALLKVPKMLALRDLVPLPLVRPS